MCIKKSYYLVGSPTVGWDNEIIFKREAAYAAAHENLSARVFISAGTEEPLNMLPNMLRWKGLLASRNYKGLQLQSHIFQDETHQSVIPVTFSRGLRYLYGVQ